MSTSKILAKKTAELAQLDERRAALIAEIQAELSALSGVPTKVARVDRPAVNGRAPAGSLRAAITKALARASAKTPMRRGAVVAAIKADGYPWSVGGEHVGKTLQDMSAEKVIAGRGERAKRGYWLRR